MELAIEIIRLMTAIAGLVAAVAALVPMARSRLRRRRQKDRQQ